MNIKPSDRLKRKSQFSNEIISPKKPRTMESKINNLVESVSSQGILGRLVVIDNNIDTSYVILQNALMMLNLKPQFTKIDDPTSNDFQLKICDVIDVKDSFTSSKDARVVLAQKALDQLKEICFFITKKQSYVNVTKSSISEHVEQPESAPPTYSIADRMMRKMGWSGGGLGSQEQGNVNCVTLVENVNRSGLGSASNNLMAEITKKIQDFAKNSPYLSLAFDSNFTKDERALIHKIAGKYRLKSKSSGSGKSRKLTVSRKLTKMDIVKQLLRMGGHDEQYTLLIPSKFAHLWSSDD